MDSVGQKQRGNGDVEPAGDGRDARDGCDRHDGRDTRADRLGRPDGLDRLDGLGDPERALGAFLRARRDRLAPEQVGLTGGRRRRVRGLRREELAQLAGISVDYYVRLEQGRATQPSPEVLDALARALDLDVTERRHLDTLAGARRNPAPRMQVSPLLRQVLDALVHFPAYVTDHRLDVVAWNGLGAELLGGLVGGQAAGRPEGGPEPADPPASAASAASAVPSTPADPSGSADPAVPFAPRRRDPNLARYIFLDPASRAGFPDWEERALEVAGKLRAFAGQYPDDARLVALVGELSERSADFRRIWATGEVIMCGAGRKRVRHPVVGSLHLAYETLKVPAAPGESGLVVHVFSAGEDGRSAAALARLAAAVTQRPEPPEPPEPPAADGPRRPLVSRTG